MIINIFAENDWKLEVKNEDKVSIVIMDISKAFYSLNHKPLVAKLEAYGLDSESAGFLQSYITKQYQGTRIGIAISDWESIIAGVPQGSILGPLLFNIFTNILFYYTEKNLIYVIMQMTVLFIQLTSPFQWYYWIKSNLPKLHCATYKTVFVVMF